MDDDPEFDLGGEKLKLSEYKKLRDLEKRRAELDRGAHERFQKAADERKSIEADKARMRAAVDKLKSDPWALFQEAGIDPDEIAEMRIAQQLKRAQMSPEQIEAEQVRAELDQLRAEKAEREESDKNTQQQQLKQHFVQKFDTDIGSALEQSGLPRTHRVVNRITDILIAYHEAKQPIDANMAARIVLDEVRGDVQGTIADLMKSNPQAVIDMLGPDAIKAITSARVATVQQGQRPQQNQRSEPKPQPPKTPETFEQVRARLGLRR